MRNDIPGNGGSVQGRIQDFKLGGGGALKKIAPSGGRRENCGGISCGSASGVNKTLAGIKKCCYCFPLHEYQTFLKKTST